MHDQRMTFLTAALLPTLLALPGGALAQDNSKVVPANAQAKQYGSGWECKLGFRRDGAACVAIKLPANAYLSDDIYGPGWACKREYKADGNSCVAVKLPQNAYLPGSSYSDDWECERGFRKAGAACVPVIVPKNGYLSDSSQSRGWDCERGFRATADACVAIKVPQNGYLSDDPFGSGWRCERGFRQSDQACVSIEIPRNAYLEASGKDWKCERGFRKAAATVSPSGSPSTRISIIPATNGVATVRFGGKRTNARRRGRPPHQWKNLMVISGGTFSIALRISSAAFASRLVSMLIPTPQPPQRM